MPNTVTSPNMGIVVPVNLTDPSPDWGARIQTALFATVDAHNHTSGNGVQVPTAGINVNADLTFGSFNATALRTTRYTSQATTLSLGTDIGCLYNVLGDAYWNNASGTAIQLTKNGAVNSTFTSYATRLNITGNITILSSDATQLFLVNATAAVTINLPAASALVAGRFYIFQDYLGLSESHPVTFVPNGTDTINGVNANFSWAQVKGSLTLTTDAAGHWYPSYTSENYEQSTGIVFPAALAGQQIKGSSPTTDVAPSNLTLAPPAPFASAVTNTTGADLIVALPASIGSGLATRLVVSQNASNLLCITRNVRNQSSTFTGLYFGTAVGSESGTNYSFAGDGNVVTLNAVTAVGVAIGNATQMAISSGVLNFSPGTVSLQSSGTTIAAVTPGGFALTSSAGPTLTSGTGAPSSTPPNGSIYLRTDGTGSTTVYERSGGAWQTLTSSLGAPVVATQVTKTANYTIDSGGSDYAILCNQSGAITITLPTPTAGRVLVIKDISGAANANNITVARSSTEKIEGVAASRILSTNWASMTLISNGTDWFIVG